MQLPVTNQAEEAAPCRVISASRRTDLPAFHADSFMQQIRAGRARYKHPFGRGPQTVSLRPEHVHSIVFWSKDYRPLLPHLDELEARGYSLYFLFTITGLPRFLEPNAPDGETAMETLEYLTRRFSPKHVSWRFDPIAFAPGLQENEHLERFTRMAKRLNGKTRRCYFSFIHFYGKVQRRLAEVGCFDPPVEQKRALAARLAAIAAQNDIEMHACCSDYLLQPGVEKGHCVDGELLSELFPDKPRVGEKRATRSGCGCCASADIGTYNTCRHGCLYCYAQSSRGGQTRKNLPDPPAP